MRGKSGLGHGAEQTSRGELFGCGGPGLGNIEEVNAVFGKAGVRQIAHTAQKEQQGGHIDAGVFLTRHDFSCAAAARLAEGNAACGYAHYPTAFCGG